MPALPDAPPPSGSPSPPFRLRTDRLLLLPLLGPDGLLDGGDGEDVLLDAVVSVVLSHPAFLATHEGSDGEVGSYDRSRLERDLAVAATPSRCSGRLGVTVMERPTRSRSLGGGLTA